MNMKKSIQGLRHIIQLVAFIVVPGLFITILSAIRSIAGAIVTGTYSFSVNGADTILLIVVLGITARNYSARSASWEI